MGTPGDALSTSAAAGAEAGAGAADSTTVACDLIRVGLFFDGTGNSRDHVGTSNIDSWHSNVDLLERQYKNSSAPETATVNGSTMKARFASAYIRGVGIEEGGGNQQWGIPRGLAWGTGPEGVAARTREGLEAARTKIRESMGGLEPCFIWLDAFGFSRGACVARDFANDIKDGVITSGDITAEVKFLGLWDTVSSIGNGGNTGNWDKEGVRINTRARRTAETIIHITAKDELRENFPLTLARGKRIEMVGVHSDIGGGYAPGTNNGSISYQAGSNDPFFDTIAQKWGLSYGDWQTSMGSRSRSTQTTNGDSLSQLQTYSQYGASNWNSFRWQAQHGLQFVALKIMFDQATANDVPLDAYGSSIEGISVGFSGDLATYYAQIKDYPHRSDAATEQNIRRKHAHMSVANSIGMGPESNGSRRVVTM
ncbi:MAG: DUF2235 domain-containing protein [Litoreibacter sp.]|uniref:phospholipase effector Tle1 domain-containing protein n=1 Tax=Litoreibacter sp. TaxID=1969459 RepID=UPI003298351B